MPRSRSFRQTSRHSEQALRGVEIEQVRNTGAGDTARACRYRTALYPLLHDREGEKAAQHAKKLVVSARADSGARHQKIVDQDTIDRLPVGDVAVMDITVEEAQDLRVRMILAIQSALVLHELTEERCEEALKNCGFHSASPSPIATSRREAMATFV